MNSATHESANAATAFPPFNSQRALALADSSCAISIISASFAAAVIAAVAVVVRLP